jgi:hypothetical protein
MGEPELGGMVSVDYLFNINFVEINKCNSLLLITYVEYYASWVILHTRTRPSVNDSTSNLGILCVISQGVLLRLASIILVFRVEHH